MPTQHEPKLDEKPEQEFVQDINAIQHEFHAEAVRPESLRSLSEAELGLMEKRLVRKLDVVIVPVIMTLYILNYIDRQNLASAKLQGILTDLNMSTQQFATAVSLLYVGYIPLQFPSNYLIARIPRPGLYICLAVVLWGIISTCTAAAQTYSQLLGIRAVLGGAEAVFFPGVVYYLSAWYTKKELGKRYAALFVGQMLGLAFGGLIAAGVINMDGVRGLRSWRWLFIIEGSITVGLGAIFAVFMPEYPHNARLLTPIERDLAVWRLDQEAGRGASQDDGDMSTLKAYASVLKDPKTYCLLACMILSQAMNTCANFFPTIMSSFGFSNTITLVITAPPYLFACFAFPVITYYSDKRGQLYIPIMFCLVIGLVVYAIALGTLNIGARYFAIMWTPIANALPQALLYNTLALHMPRPYPKRAAAMAILNAIGGTSNVWGSYVWYGAPHFYAGFGMVLAANVAFICIITGYRFYVLNENKKLDEGGERAKSAMRYGITQEQLDMGWRYTAF